MASCPCPPDNAKPDNAKPDDAKPDDAEPDDAENDSAAIVYPARRNTPKLLDQKAPIPAFLNRVLPEQAVFRGNSATALRKASSNGIRALI